MTSQTTLASSCRCFSQALSGSGSVGGFWPCARARGSLPEPRAASAHRAGPSWPRLGGAASVALQSHSWGRVGLTCGGMGASFICCDSLLWGGGSEETGKAAWRV